MGCSGKTKQGQKADPWEVRGLRKFGVWAGKETESDSYACIIYTFKKYILLSKFNTQKRGGLYM